MSIDNTQWANYDNRKVFDHVLQQLRPWGYTDESNGNDAAPKICLLGDAMHEHDILIFIGSDDPEMGEAFFTDFSGKFVITQDANFLTDLGQRPRDFYQGDSVGQLIKLAKQIAPAQETYSELYQLGYEIISTGGGFTSWAKSFGDYCVTVTGDGFAHLISRIEDTDELEVDEVVCLGVSERGSHYWGAGEERVDDGSDMHSWVRVGDRRGLAASLEVAETIAYEASMEGVDLLADLSTFFNLMLSKHCPGKTQFSADEFLMQYGDVLRGDQKRLLSSFIRFWDEVANMERRS